LTILVAPLCWGLGHATRCIPLIRAWGLAGHDVVIGSDGDALGLLRREFPDLPYLVLPSYNIRYGSSNMAWNMLVQLPKIGWAVVREHFSLRRFLGKNKVDLVVSDNRFGLFSGRSRTVFVTHQVNIQVPNRLLGWLVNVVNHWFIGRFGEFWVLDFEGDKSLAGALSAPLPASLKGGRYIGTLSRMVYYEVEKVYDCVAVLSGPEPQRSIFEDEIRVLFAGKPVTDRLLIVRGVVTSDNKRGVVGNLSCVDYMTSEELNGVLLASRLVICRSGYSTIMDLVATKSAAILVATPGQTEQEYLAKRFGYRLLVD
jgi:hypothetical protein